jgi:hypothetical protein
VHGAREEFGVGRIGCKDNWEKGPKIVNFIGSDLKIENARTVQAWTYTHMGS